MRNDYTKSTVLKELPVKLIVFVGHKIKGKNYYIQPQQHRGHELIYVDYGRMQLNVNTRKYILENGDCFLIPENTAHFLKGDNGKPFDFLNIVFKGSLLKSIGNQTLQTSHQERNIMLSLKQESENKVYHNRELLLVKLNELLLLLDRHHSQTIRGELPKGENRIKYQQVVIDKALNYLFEQRCKPLNIEHITRYAGISQSHLRMLVRKETGMSLRQHLRRFRIDFAKHLLKESPENVDTIAYRVGYNSIPHFCTIFKREVKMTPSEYAKSLG